MVCTIATRDVGPLFYWCFLHNHHHTHCDTGKDIHSPKHSSFWCVHFNFAYSAAEADRFKLMDKLPENSPRSFKQLQTSYDADLSWLTMMRSVMVFFGEIFLWMALGVYLSRMGYDVLPFELWAWGNFMPRVLTHHAVSLTNSAAHTFGSRPYTGRPDSPYPLCEATNCWWAAWLNFGEGWHSNHHAFALSARHGLLWWEVDMVYYGLCLLGYAGLVWNMKTVDDSIRFAPRDQPIDKHPTVKYVTQFAK
jgi:stearoyl-CoA desaturase (delta-9 desaturase)